MKKLITLFILIAGTYMSFAQTGCDLTQDKIILNTLCSSFATSLPNGDGTLAARDAIDLVPGFDANANAFNGHSFTLKTDHSVANQNIMYLASQTPGPGRTLDKTNCIPGSIGGSIDISATGAANYSLPILVSPGTHGMLPKLSIVYSSQSGNDILGYGWHLTGLSAISRVSKNNYYDGACSPLSLSSKDALVLDGQRLISTGTNVYSPENNPYTSVTYNGTSFTVTTQDGMVMEYGNTVDSRFLTKGGSVPVNWALDKVSDSDGNYIQFIYSSDNTTGEYRINEINYTGNDNAGLVPYNSVKFYYDKRADINSSFIAGGQINQSVLLTGIKVFSENILSKDYEFSYFNDGMYSKLNQIALSADGVTYNPTIVNWGTIPDYATTVTDAGSLLGKLNTNQLYFGDLNGDGRTDIISWDKGSVITASIAKADGTYTTSSMSLSSMNSTTTSGPGWESTRSDINTIIDISVFDINNDGKDDIVVHYKEVYNDSEEEVDQAYSFLSDDQETYSKVGRFYFDRNSGNFAFEDRYPADHTGGSSSNSDGYSTNYPAHTYTYYYADLNNDGIIDRLKVQDGTLIGCDGLTLSSVPGIKIDNIKLLDVDGDGQLELLVLTNNGNGSIYKYDGSTFVDMYANTGNTRTFWGKPANVYVGDFNGDGKTDILRYNPTSTYANKWEILYSQGVITSSIDFVTSAAPLGMSNYEPANTGLENKQATHLIQDTNPYCDGNMGDFHQNPLIFNPATCISIDDINNDGKSDIIYGLQDNISIFLSNGTSFFQQAPIKPSSVGENGIYNLIVYTIDLDGDGQKELIYGNDDHQVYCSKMLTGFCSNNGGYYCVCDAKDYYSYENYKKITFNKRLDQNLYVNSITDGNNINSAITYVPTFTNAAGVRNYPVIPITGPVNLASKLETTDLNTNTVLSNISYTFQNGYIHAQGKGFLGYTSISSSDIIRNIARTTNYSFTLIGATGIYYTWPNSESSSRNNNLISSETYNMSYVGGDITKKFFLPVMTSKIVTDNLKNITTTTSNTVNPTSGRLEQQTISAGGWTTQVNTTYVNVSGNVSKPTQIISTKTHGSDTYTLTVKGIYGDPNPLHLTSVTQQNLITDNYTYGSFGNVVNKATVTADGTRTNGFVYDSKGRFVVSSTDAANYTSTATYRSADGAKLTETDPNNLTTTYAYLPQGNSFSITTTSPDGKVSTSTTGWDGSGNGLYYAQKQITQGNTVFDYFNSAGQKIKETSLGFKGALKTTTYTYNPDGTANTVLSPGFTIPVAYSYYPTDGRLQQMTGPNMNISYSYSANTTTTTNNISGETKTQTYDAIGNLTQVNGTKGLITYDYFASGKVKDIMAGGSTTSMTYNSLGNQLTLTDPDAGVTNYIYNGFGQLKTQTDAKSQMITCGYDPAGRLISKSGTGMNETYTYFTTPGKLGLLQNATRDGISETYDYDNLCRPWTITKIGAGKTFITSYRYDSYGRLYRTTYPTGLTVEYGYDQVSNLSLISNAADGSKIWTGDSKNDREQWTNYSLGNGLATTWGYNESNYSLNTIQTGTTAAPTSIQNLGFTFNDQGQLTNRTDGSLSESFTFDPFDRLNTAKVAGQDVQTYQYADNGNINNTTLAGTYNYLANQPHAVQNVIGVTSTGQAPQLLTTSDFTIDNKLSVMDNGTYKNTFTYGPDDNRFKVDQYQGGSLQSSKLYDCNNEFVLDKAGNITYSRTLIYAPTGICAVYEKDATNTANFYYIHTDYLGSWLAITNQQGSLTNRYSYDAWGRPRDPSTWQLKPVSITNALADLNSMQPRFDRGYTGHEHMAGFGLINMNGRLYDPYLQRFLSPDNYVQDPENTQNYNRYSYCLNNPLGYTDPTGFTEDPISPPTGPDVPVTPEPEGIPDYALDNIWWGIDGGMYYARLNDQPFGQSFGYYSTGDGMIFGSWSNTKYDLTLAAYPLASIPAPLLSYDTPSSAIPTWVSSESLWGNSDVTTGNNTEFENGVAQSGGVNSYPPIDIHELMKNYPNDPPGNTSDIFTDLADALPVGLLRGLLSVTTRVTATEGTNLVYQGLDAAGTVRYVGITERAAATRFAEHAASIGTGKENLIYRVVNGAEDLSRIDARVWEQTLINQYGLGKNGGLLLNKINSIAPKNWWQYGINP